MVVGPLRFVRVLSFDNLGLLRWLRWVYSIFYLFFSHFIPISMWRVIVTVNLLRWHFEPGCMLHLFLGWRGCWAHLFLGILHSICQKCLLASLVHFPDHSLVENWNGLRKVGLWYSWWMYLSPFLFLGGLLHHDIADIQPFDSGPPFHHCSNFLERVYILLGCIWENWISSSILYVP